MKSDRQAVGTYMRARDFVVLWGPVLLCMAAIFYVSSVSTWTTGTGPPAYKALRKLGHVIEFAALALLIGRALAGTWTLRMGVLSRSALAAVWRTGALLTTAYAFTDELHQAFVPRREFHLTDILIDALSATAALGIWYIVRTWRQPATSAGLEQR